MKPSSQSAGTLLGAALVMATLAVWPAEAPHWAFQALTHPRPPPAKNSTWAGTDIDRFILASLTAHGLQPAPAAEWHVLLRRVCLDLTGLPPTPEEVAAFDRDASEPAFIRVVERLLSSPRYGERWAPALPWFMPTGPQAMKPGGQRGQRNSCQKESGKHPCGVLRSPRET